ncbi:MAG: SPOR domain-containing protein [Bdellovibrionales bacterium]|nr:SPOR domain-containing protein [Bdellovibrionales bacterium]
MNKYSGPRTSPTVKPLATTSKKNLRYWEFKVSMVQVVVLAGALTGSIACSFFLGYFTGQRTGFDQALASSIDNLARMPVALERERQGDDDSLIENVYARLDDSTATVNALLDQAQNKETEEASPMPQLGALKTLEEAPLPELEEVLPEEPEMPEAHAKAADAKRVSKQEDSMDVAAVLAESDQALDDFAEKPEKSSGASVRQLGVAKKNNERSSKSLGGLIESRKELEANRIAASKQNEKPSGPVANQQTRGFGLNSASKDQSISKIVATQNELKRSPSEQSTSTPKRSGWYAQVAAPKAKGDADTLANRLRTSGFRVTIETAQVRGENYYRVLVGPEDTRVLAERLVSQVKRERFIQGDPFVRMVK